MANLDSSSLTSNEDSEPISAAYPKSRSTRRVVNIHPLSLAKAIWQHKFMCVGLWIVLTSATVYIVHRLPPVYRSEAIIQVESQRIPEKYVAATVNSDLQDRLNMLSEQILSYSRLIAVVQKYGLYPKGREHQTQEELYDKIRADITIKPDGIGIGRPGAFRISYQGPNAPVTAQVANEIASFFIDENYHMREVEAMGTSQFLQTQLADAKKRLEAQEATLSRYKLQFNGELPQQENALLASLGQAKVQLTGVQDALNRAQQNKTLVEASLGNAQTTETALVQMAEQASAGDAVPVVIPGAAAVPVPPPAPKQSEQLEAQLMTLMTRYGEGHPEVRRVKAELDRARQAEAAKTASSSPALLTDKGSKVESPKPPKPPSPVAAQAMQSVANTRERIDNLKSQLTMVNGEIATLNKERESVLREVESLEARMAQLPVREQQLASVTRDYETTKAAYQSLLNNKLAADVAAQMEKGQKSERFVLLESAHVPQKPVKPKREMLDAAGSVVGLALSLALGVGLSFRRSVVIGEWELPESLIILGRIPAIPPGPNTRRRNLLAVGGRRAS